MLPAEHRLRRPAEFTAVLRRGRRASRPLLSVHLLTAGEVAPEMSPEMSPEVSAGSASCSRAGLVVSKAVGGSVVRHRTARRLRHALRPYVVGAHATLPAGSQLVVRAAPGAGSADQTALDADLAAAVTAVLAPRPARRARPSGAAGPSR